MEIELFDVIDYKLADIMTMIEIKMPILMKDIPDFICQSEENAKLYDIYLKISELRNI